MAKSVLIVEADSTQKLLLRRLFESADWVPTLVNSLDEAMSFLKTQAPHLITIDISLPKGNPFAFIATCQADKLLRQIPIMVISANRDIEVIQRCISLGASDYCLKPIRALSLMNKLAKIAKISNLLRCTFQGAQMPIGSFSLGGKIQRISPSGFMIEAPIKFTMATPVTLASNNSNQKLVQELLFIAVPTVNTSSTPNFYTLEVQAVGAQFSLAKTFEGYNAA